MESIAETQPQLHPALLRLSAIVLDHLRRSAARRDLRAYLLKSRSERFIFSLNLGRPPHS
jgi:hypothetical protein